MMETEAIIKTAKIHEARLLEALAVVDKLFPLDIAKINNISQDNFFALETLTSRFARLQDLIGSKLFDLCLNSLGEVTDGLSMIDKANKLEKLSIIDKAHTWMEMRKLRNSITHEYPDKPEITVNILNKMNAMIPIMLDIYHKMLNSIIRQI